MMNLMWIGGITVVVGAAISTLSRALGIAFCRIGKAIHRHGLPPFPKPDEQELDRCFPEDKMPRNFLVLGVSAAAGGCVIIVLGLLMN